MKLKRCTLFCRKSWDGPRPRAKTEQTKEVADSRACQLHPDVIHSLVTGGHGNSLCLPWRLLQWFHPLIRTGVLRESF